MPWRYGLSSPLSEADQTNTHQRPPGNGRVTTLSQCLGVARAQWAPRIDGCFEAATPATLWAAVAITIGARMRNMGILPSASVARAVRLARGSVPAPTMRAAAMLCGVMPSKEKQAQTGTWTHIRWLDGEHRRGQLIRLAKPSDGDGRLELLDLGGELWVIVGELRIFSPTSTRG